LESIGFEEMTAFAADIKALGYDVSVSWLSYGVEQTA
jgi:hypothetical protein